jgi:hypothetical protein
MRQPFLYSLLFSGILLAISSCTPLKPAPAHSSPNLFDNTDDSLLFAPAPKNMDSLSADSAYRISIAVAAGSVLFIDSTMHNGQRAPFYLLCARIDTVLKGSLRPVQKLYFAATTLPAFDVGPQAKWLFYLSRIDNKEKLLAYHLNWQWTNHAPAVAYMPPVKDTGSTVALQDTPRHHRAIKHAPAVAYTPPVKDTDSTVAVQDTSRHRAIKKRRGRRFRR